MQNSKVMTRRRFDIICVCVTGAVLAAGYFYLGRDFDQHEQLRFAYPVIEGKHGAALARMLVDHIEQYGSPGDFPETRDGIHNLKKLFIYEWSVEPDLMFGLVIHTKCPLYQELKHYYPELEKCEMAGGEYVSLDRIVDRVIDREPSKFRQVLWKTRDALGITPAD